MRKLNIQVELEVIKAEFYDFVVEVEVPEDTDLTDEELVSEMEDEASSLARQEYWKGDQRPYDTQTDEFNTIASRLWD